jgi:hypothetical protein
MVYRTKNDGSAVLDEIFYDHLNGPLELLCDEFVVIIYIMVDFIFIPSEGGKGRIEAIGGDVPDWQRVPVPGTTSHHQFDHPCAKN